MRNINQRISRVKDRDRLLEDVCGSLVATSRYQHAWIVLVDESRRVAGSAQAGLGEGFAPLLACLREGGLSPCAEQVLTLNGAMVLEEGAALCTGCALDTEHRVEKVLAAPCALNDRVYGMMVAALGPGHVADAEEISLFDEAAADVAFALHNLELEEERRRAQDALRWEESRLETLLELNQMTDAPLQAITDFALEEAVRLTGSQLGYLAFMNEDESVLTMHSWSKTAMEECAITDKPLVYPLETTGLWGEAVRQRQPVITNDYAAPNPLKKGYPGRACADRAPHERADL